MSLLLDASPAWRCDVARRWSIPADSDGPIRAVDLYRQMTDETRQRTLLTQLTGSQLSLLVAILSGPARGVRSAKVVRQVFLSETRVGEEIAEMCSLGLATSDGRTVGIPGDLAPALRRILGELETARAGRCRVAQTPRRPAMTTGGDPAARQGISLAATALTAVDEPRTVLLADNSLFDDIERELLARCPIDRASERTDTAQERAGGAEGKHAMPGGAVSSDRLALARHFVLRLGLLDAKKPRQTLEASAWRCLEVTARARAVYEVWLSDREWRESAPGQRARVRGQGVVRADRVRQQLRLALSDASDGVWYAMQGVPGRASAACYSSPDGNRWQASHGSGGIGPRERIVEAVLVAFHWLGGVDLGTDAQNRPVAFRLTTLGSALVAGHRAHLH